MAEIEAYTLSMGITPHHYGNVENGKLELENKERFLKYLHTLNGRVTISVKKYRKGRTLGQNALYWMYLTIIAEETGDDPNSLHEFFKRKFLPPRFIKTKYGEMKVPSTTTKLTVSEFTNYMNSIELLTGVPIPNTDDLST